MPIVSTQVLILTFSGRITEICQIINQINFISNIDLDLEFLQSDTF